MAIIDGIKVKLFSLSANRELAEEISKYSGISLSHIDLSRFADGEVAIMKGIQKNGADKFGVPPLGVISIAPVAFP